MESFATTESVDDKIQALVKRFGAGKVAKEAARRVLEAKNTTSSPTPSRPSPPRGPSSSAAPHDAARASLEAALKGPQTMPVDIERMFAFELREPVKPSWETPGGGKPQPLGGISRENVGPGQVRG